MDREHEGTAAGCQCRRTRAQEGRAGVQGAPGEPYVWPRYVPSDDGPLPGDNVLLSTDAQYWDIHNVQRYFLGELHCEQVLFTYQYPNLRLPSRLGSYLWRFNTSLKLPSATYLKEYHRSFEVTLKKMEAQQSQMDRLIVCDQLIKLNCLDYCRRKTFFRILNNILSFQDRLQLVSFENLCCTRLEGLRLLQQLACFNADTLKYLFLWRFVLPNENPILINYSYITGSGQYLSRPDSRWDFMRALLALRNLRVLALEYAHLADSTGGTLLSLVTVLRRPRMRLQLICREDQIPGHMDEALGVGGHVIPDPAWKRIAVDCPDLYLLMAFCRIRDYDELRRFLTPSIPLREVHVQYGVDLHPTQRQDSDVSCIVRHLAFRYANTLACLSIHQWRFVTFPLRRAFELMPRLRRFEYVGRVQDEVELERLLQTVACGIYEKLTHLKIQIQDEVVTRAYWSAVIDVLCKKYADIMDLFDIHLCISVYKN